MGGITTTEDAIQMIAAGARIYGVGTGVIIQGKDIFKKINNGIDAYLADKKISYDDLVGIAHKQ